ncbi:hypothetical protein ONS95_007251 [Cadophora gregata]|uniref:uncharacterized protein n=1 Tax=Cadophora gregata TaxID=51156 RepID=UPI0026DBE59F|nr:uncharacterized protein ONS95_007251 [Cadophora gregata]KAK0100804.1 hypothetical protein ONS95_007251 [Cadophora gregata]KAK0117202.1 hypothetical protein ONS96_013036 [Cadophora gregata f. sp. sojae]
MAEVAIGIVSLGIQVCQGLLKYYGSWKDGPKDAATMCSFVESLSETLVQLEQTLARTPEISATVISCIEACRSSIEKLDKKLSKVQSVSDPGKMKSRIHDQGRRLLYPFRESTLAKLKEIVTDIRSNLALAVDTTQLQTSLNISGQVRDLAAFIKDRDRDLESREIINWLSPLRFYECQVDTLSQQEDGTGEWIFASPEFQKWVSGSRKTLWCWGQPGAGKTVLASSIINRLESQLLSSTDALAYIYCSYKDRSSQTLVALVSSLVQQITRSCTSIPESVRSLYQQHQSRNTRPAVSEYSNLLRDLITIFPRTYLVIDALDECQETNEARSKFIKLLLDLPTNVHLLCTSRKLGDITESFASASSLEITGNNSDIELFLTGQISGNRRLRSFCEISPDLKRTVLGKIVSNATGMFLLAKLHIQSLKTKTSSRQVRKALERLPAKLSTVYHDAIQRIRGQHEEEAQLAMRLLAWITHSYRPLKIEELQQAMAVMDFEPDDKSISEEDLPTESMMITVCGGLAVVDPRSRIVRLVHYTTEEYFDTYREELFPDARVEIARSCVRYLSMDTFSQGVCRRYEDMKRQREKYKLLKYASINWGKHASGYVEVKIKDEILALLKDAALLSTLNHTIYNSKDDIAGLGLLTAARYDLVAIVDALLTSGININTRGKRGQTAVHEASSNGHEQMVQLLLEKGANLHLMDDNGSTPLITAASSGHGSIIHLLLNLELESYSGWPSPRKDVYVVDHDHETALHKAVHQGSEPIASLLLDNGAYIHGRNIRGETPLFLAVENGSLGIVKLLLEKGSAVDTRDSAKRTPLRNAVLYGDEALTQVLCDYGADISAEAEDGLSPLHVALKGGQWRVIKLLLTAESNFPLNIPTALHMAAKSGYLEGAKALLDNGADIASRDIEGGTILFCAAKSDHLELMELFVAYNGDLEAKDGMGRTALYIAARQDWPGIQSLISVGATTDTQDITGNSPLSEAILGSRHQSIIESLLQHRNPRILNHSEMASLHQYVDRASGWVHPIFKSLIENDVQINDTELFTKAFLQTVRQSLPHGVAFFLEVGVPDIEARDREGKTALQIAASWNSAENQEIIKSLIENGADIEAVDVQSRTFKFSETCLHIKPECGTDIPIRTVLKEQHIKSLRTRASSGLTTPNPQSISVIEETEHRGRNITTLPSTHLSFARQLGLDF